MREIKFRGKGYLNGVWVYGYYFVAKYATPFIVTEKNEFILICKEEVGQFTGLLDKKGKEIYEGDIIEGFTSYGKYDDLGIITYDNAKFDVGVNGHEYYDYVCGFIAKAIYNECDNTEYLTGCFGKRECLIIGNIHDNPELLELTK